MIGLPKVDYDNCVTFLQACDRNQQMCQKDILEAEVLLKEGKRDEFVEAVTLLMYVARPREVNSNRLH